MQEGSVMQLVGKVSLTALVFEVPGLGYCLAIENSLHPRTEIRSNPNVPVEVPEEPGEDYWHLLRRVRERARALNIPKVLGLDDGMEAQRLLKVS